MTDAITTKEVWIAWTNTDLTEGKGSAAILAICELEATAHRLGKGKSVQGTNCHVAKGDVLCKRGVWYAPWAVIHRATESDKLAQDELDARRAAIAKAKGLGMTREELQAMGVHL